MTCTIEGCNKPGIKNNGRSVLAALTAAGLAVGQGDESRRACWCESHWLTWAFHGTPVIEKVVAQ